MTLTLAGFAIAVLGAGEWSLDHALEIFDPPGTDGLLIALIAGVGGAAALLAAAWRPPKHDRLNPRGVCAVAQGRAAVRWVATALAPRLERMIE